MAIEIDSFIKLQRQITQWEWYTDTNTKSLFIHLVLMAQHKDTEWRGITLKRGQLLTGRLLLSKQTGLSEREIRTAINKLKTTNEIAVRTTNQFSVITVNNYNTYQEKKDVDRPAERPTERPTTDQRATTCKNVKNDKKKTLNTDSVKTPVFTIPEKRETADLFISKGSTNEEAGRFWYFYDSKGWMVGKVKMTNWTSAAYRWISETKKQEARNGAFNGNEKRDALGLTKSDHFAASEAWAQESLASIRARDGCEQPAGNEGQDLHRSDGPVLLALAT